jgi:Kef-type K+ transport system membrane component KefB
VAGRPDRRPRGGDTSDFSFGSLLAIAVAAVAAPLLSELVPRHLLPPVVLEVAAGVVLGPQVLGVIHLDETVKLLSVLGLGFLLFLAGMEITPRSLIDRRGRSGVVAYALAAAVALPLALGLRAAGAHADLRILDLALTSTSLGILLPILRDAGETDTGFGQAVLVTASVGEFASLLLITILFSADPKSTPEQILYVVGLAVSAALAVVVVTRWWTARWFSDALLRLDETTSQLRVRSAFILLLLFAALVHGFGLDAVLGAFVAGIVLSQANRAMPAAAADRYLAKLNAVGFGFLVPVFFIATGAALDVRAVFASGRTLLLVPLFALGFVLARGVPAALVLGRDMTRREAVAAGAFQATSLTFPVVAATIGTSLGFMDRPTAAALIMAGVVSVVVLPASAQLLRPWETPAPSPAGPSAGP